MSFSRLRPYFALLSAIVITAVISVAQTPGPTSGEITVQLVQGLDSATNLKGMSQGVVTKSSTLAIPIRSAVLVGLRPDPINGGYTTKLIAVQINSRAIPTASSAVALAPDVSSKLPSALLGKSGNAVSGTHVFLPAQTFIKFTLTEPPVRTPTAPVTTPTFVKWSSTLEKSDLMTRDLVNACTAQDGEHQAFCYGVLMLFYDQSLAAADSESYKPSYCIPATASIGQMRDAFLDDARKRSDQVDSPITLFFSMTWENEFPCPKAPPKPKHTSAKKK